MLDSAQKTLRTAKSTKFEALLCTSIKSFAGEQVKLKRVVQNLLHDLGSAHLNEDDVLPVLWAKAQDAVHFRKI
jgi:hypothetical protein